MTVARPGASGHRRLTLCLVGLIALGIVAVRPVAAQAAFSTHLDIDSPDGTPTGALGAPLDPAAVAQQPFGLADLPALPGGTTTSESLYVADPANKVVRRIAGGKEDVAAGNGGMGGEGDGGSPANAQLGGAYGLAVDRGPNNQPLVYIADAFGNKIRAVDAAGKMATVAGTGSFGFSGDGGNPAAAQLDSPYAVAIVHVPGGTEKDLYVADTLNNRIRMLPLNVTPSLITTVAGTGTAGHTGDGGPATAATLDQPRGLTADCSGNLYIADTYNNVVRRYDTATRVISSVAGTGTAGYAGDNGPATRARLNHPTGLAFNSDCSALAIADTGNNVIREVDMAGGAIATIAGTGAAGFGGDGGSPLAAQLNSPFAVAFISGGSLSATSLAIGDTGNNRVRLAVYSNVVNGPPPSISTIAGNGTPHLSESLLLQGEFTGAALPQLGGPVAAMPLTLNFPVGNQFCSGAGPKTMRAILETFSDVLRFDCPGGSSNLTTVLGNGLPGEMPLAGVNTASVNAGDNGLTSKLQLAFPMGMAITHPPPNGNPDIYIADTVNNVVWDVTLSPRDLGGSFTTAIDLTARVIAGTGVAGYSGDSGPATSARLNHPTGLAVDAANDLFIADSYNARVRRVDAVTHDITTVAGTGVLGGAGDGGPAAQARLFFPYGVAVDPTAAKPDVYIADSFDNEVRVVNGVSGTISLLAGSGTAGFADGPAATAQFDRPWGISVDAGTPQPDVVVADFLNHRIRLVSGTTVSTVTGTGNPGLAGDPGAAPAAEVNAPRGVDLLDAQGAMLIADAFNNRVRRLGTGNLETPIGLIAFGAQRTGTPSAAQSVNIANTGTGFLIVDVASTGTNATAFLPGSCTGFSAVALGPGTWGLPPGTNCSLQVTFAPSLAGANAATLEISPDDGQAPALDPLTGTGIQPALTFLASNNALSNLSFSGGTSPTLSMSATVPSASSDFFQIWNSGSANMIITSVTLSDPNGVYSLISPMDSNVLPAPYINTQTCQSLIGNTTGLPSQATQPGTTPPPSPATCAIEVRFEPLAVTAYDATITITDDAGVPFGQHATQTVQVHGLGEVVP